MGASRRYKGAVLAAMAAVAGLGGCAFSPPLSPADRATLDECRDDADRVYNAQNRNQLSERGAEDSPFSGGAQRVTPSDGLADRYSHERMVSDCVRHGSLQPAGVSSQH